MLCLLIFLTISHGKCFIFLHLRHSCLLLQWLLFPSCFHARLNPILGEVIILFLNLGQVCIDLFLKALEADLVGFSLAFAEESHWMSQWVILVLCTILCISDIIHPLSQSGQVSQVLLLCVSALFSCTILAQFIYFFLIARILCHVTDV